MWPIDNQLGCQPPCLSGSQLFPQNKQIVEKQVIQKK